MLFAAFGSVDTVASAAEFAVPQQQPLVRAVFFHADWCSNCRMIAPVLDQAKNDGRNLRVEHLTLDFTNPASWDQAIEIALDHNVVSVYNAYAGTTGLVVLVAADTGERIDCVNRLYTAPAMVQAFESAVHRVETTPPGSRDVGSIVCPAGRMAP
jgi:thiol-disulfide isomerase/thioredoxin